MLSLHDACICLSMHAGRMLSASRAWLNEQRLDDPQLGHPDRRADTEQPTPTGPQTHPWVWLHVYYLRAPCKAVLSAAKTEPTPKRVEPGAHLARIGRQRSDLQDDFHDVHGVCAIDPLPWACRTPARPVCLGRADPPGSSEVAFHDSEGRFAKRTAVKGCLARCAGSYEGKGRYTSRSQPTSRSHLD